jgi:MerR family transcriptional regulator, copper efflux regulator
MNDMRISELASRSGVPVTTLRFYDRAGLLPADRTPAGYRVYDEAAAERLDFIAAVKRLGIPLEEIAGLVRVRASGTCAQLRSELMLRLAARIGQAEQQAADLAVFITALRGAAARLESLPDSDGPCRPDCGCTSEGAAPDLACTLDAAELPQRVAQWRALLAGAGHEVIPGGLRFTLPASLAGPAAGLAAAEQACCAFFDFRLHLAGAEVHLEIRGPAEAVAIFGSDHPADHGP